MIISHYSFIVSATTWRRRGLVRQCRARHGPADVSVSRGREVQDTVDVAAWQVYVSLYSFCLAHIRYTACAPRDQ